MDLQEFRLEISVIQMPFKVSYVVETVDIM